jgi:hypothetical protein
VLSWEAYLALRHLFREHGHLIIAVSSFSYSRSFQLLELKIVEVGDGIRLGP